MARLSLMNADGSDWELNQLMFADDTAQVANSEYKLRQLIEEFGRIQKIWKLRTNESKNKVMNCTRKANDMRMNGNCEWKVTR